MKQPRFQVNRFLFLLLVSFTALITLEIFIAIPGVTDSKKKVVHISFDDIYEVLDEVTINSEKYASVFESGFFGFLKNE